MKRWRQIVLACAAVVVAGAAEKPENDIAIKMSPYEVSANSVDFKRWIKVSSPNYIVYTDADLKEANAVIRELELVHLAAQSFFRRRVLSLPPTIVVLPTSGSDWRKLESKGNVEWRVAVSQPGERLVNMILVQYDWQDQTAWIVRAPQARILLEAMNLNGPFWFERGVSKFFETTEFGADNVVLGRQNSRTRAVVMEGWLKWPRFFQVDMKSREFVKEFEVGRFEGQCAAFVQYMLANPEPVWFERLIEWAALLDAGREPTDEEFKRVFGQDFKAWQKTMDAYMRGGRYYVRTFKLPSAAMNFASVKIDLPVREMRELFVVAQILNQNVPASDQSLDTLLARGLKTEALRELLAEACFKRNRKDAGVEQVKLCVAAGATNPALHVALAMDVLVRAIEKPGLEARLSARDAAIVREECGKALQLEPRYKPANEALAWTEALAPAVDAPAVERIEKIYRVLEGQVGTSTVLSALAVARWRTGDKAGARSVAEALLGSPFCEKEAREIATSLVAVLDIER